MSHCLRSCAVSLAASIAIAATLCACIAPVTSAKAARGSKPHGEQIFAATGCAHCHGPAGLQGGDGPSLKDVRKHLSASQMATQIHDGGKAMPAFGEQLSSAQIDDLVEYLRSKRKVPKASTKFASAPIAPSAP